MRWRGGRASLLSIFPFTQKEGNDKNEKNHKATKRNVIA